MEKQADSQDARNDVPDLVSETDPDLVSDAESSVMTDDVLDAVGLSSTPRIRMWLDIPPWLAALTLALTAHVLTTTAETCRCR
jgi:hypothetical protein